MNNCLKLTCSYCNYFTNRKFNLNRHEISKHSLEILNNIKNDNSIGNTVFSEGNTVFSKGNTVLSKGNTVLSEEETISDNKNELKCNKCNKIYKTKKYLKNHEEKCKGIDNLTCPRCMKYFADSSSKSKHIKRNTCHAKSIIHARIPNIQNITNNITNIMTNSNNKTINYNNIITNNYGHERLDYMTKDIIIDFLKKGNKTIPLFIEYKHFNKDFPENHNIIYDEKTKKCKYKENDIWKNINVNFFCNKLIKDNSSYLLTFYKNNKEVLDNNIKNEEVLEHIFTKLLNSYHKMDKDNYIIIFNELKLILINLNILVLKNNI